jgi:hypothetical protein
VGLPGGLIIGWKSSLPLENNGLQLRNRNPPVKGDRVRKISMRHPSPILFLHERADILRRIYEAIELPNARDWNFYAHQLSDLWWQM